MRIAKFCHLTFFFLSTVLMGVIGYQFSKINVDLHANFLEESNLSWPQIKVEIDAIDHTNYIFLG